jgi:hypothetical protein
MYERLLLVDLLRLRAVADVLARGSSVHRGLARISANAGVATVGIEDLFSLGTVGIDEGILRLGAKEKAMSYSASQQKQDYHGKNNCQAAIAVILPTEITIDALKADLETKLGLSAYILQHTLRCESATAETTETPDSSLFCWVAMKALTSSPVSRQRIKARRRRGEELGMSDAFPKAKMATPSI